MTAVGALSAPVGGLFRETIITRAAILAALALGASAGFARHAPLQAGTLFSPRSDPYRATTSRAARQSAIRSIPYEKLDTEAKTRVARVLSTAAVFRRLPIRVIQCDPELYLFLVRHPDVVVNIWEVLGVSQLTMRQTGPDTFQMADGQGMVAVLKFLYRSHDTHLIYIEGRYDGSLSSRPVRCRGLMVLKTGYVREPDGRYYITSRLDTFAHITPGGVEFLTNTFQPLVGKVADMNFVQTAGFVGSLSRTAEVNHRGVERLAARLHQVRPDVRQEFAELAGRVAQKAEGLSSLRLSDRSTVATRSAGASE